MSQLSVYPAAEVFIIAVVEYGQQLVYAFLVVSLHDLQAGESCLYVLFCFSFEFFAVFKYGYIFKVGEAVQVKLFIAFCHIIKSLGRSL